MKQYMGGLVRERDDGMFECSSCGEVAATAIGAMGHAQRHNRRHCRFCGVDMRVGNLATHEPACKENPDRQRRKRDAGRRAGVDPRQLVEQLLAEAQRRSLIPQTEREIGRLLGVGGQRVGKMLAEIGADTVDLRTIVVLARWSVLAEYGITDDRARDVAVKRTPRSV